jgi:hypothetical protein
MYQDKQKIINYVSVKSDVFDWLITESNKKGVNIRYYVGDLMEYLYVTRDSFNDLIAKTPDAKILFIKKSMQRQQELRASAYQIAAIYTENPTEQNADKLKEACDIANVGYDEVLQSIALDPFSSIIAQATSRTNIDKCVVWFTNLFNKQHEINSNEVYKLAHEAGYTDKTIQRVRNIINQNPESPKIISARKGRVWVMRMVENSNNADVYFPIKEDKPVPVAFDFLGVVPENINVFEIDD